MSKLSKNNIGAVRIVEVGPRDGLQGEAVFVATQDKLELTRRLMAAGLSHIEVTSFVSPVWVPQMSDHAELMLGLKESPSIRFSVLAPNLKGFEEALACGAKEVAIFASASESFSQRNTNCTIAQSLERLRSVAQAALQSGIRLRGYVSCAIACPYEGAIDPVRVLDIASRLLEMGCYEISLADTTGVATPHDVERLLETVSRQAPMETLAGHYHDTYGMALANIHTAYRMGMRTFDSSVAGLGGCPYARGATGNVATEDVVYLFNGMGVHTGVDIGRLTDCAAWISEMLGRQPSRVASALLARRRRSTTTACS